MKNPLKIFHIRREERWPALAVLLYVATLNALVVGKYFDKFTQLSDNYHKLFVALGHGIQCLPAPVVGLFHVHSQSD